MFFDHLYETVSILEAVRNEQGDIMLGAEVLTRHLAVYSRVLETGEPSYYEAAYQDKHFLVSVSCMDENRVASIGLDITEQKQAEIELKATHHWKIELKYHRPDKPPVVKVHARQLPGRVQILVEDNGIGFDQNKAEQMFLPFQRLVGRS